MRSWLTKRRIDRREATSEEVRHARSLIRLLRTQDRLPNMSADELIERIVSWRPLPAGGRSRTTVERGRPGYLQRGGRHREHGVP
jgi:hypothetical protein